MGDGITPLCGVRTEQNMYTDSHHTVLCGIFGSLFGLSLSGWSGGSMPSWV